MIDILVHTSTAPEPFGRVLVEAMASHRPIVAFRRGSTTSVLGDQTALFASTDRVEDVADARRAAACGSNGCARHGRESGRCSPPVRACARRRPDGARVRPDPHVRVLMVGLATFDEMAGGSARYLSGLAEATRALGHEVDIVTAARHVPAAGYSERGLLGQVVRSLRRLALVLPSSFVDVIRTRPDVVNVHFALDGIGAVLAAAATGLASLSTSRDHGRPRQLRPGFGAGGASARRSVERSRGGSIAGRTRASSFQAPFVTS